MPYCGKCGLQVDENVKFCPGCGGAIGAEQTVAQKNDFEEKFKNLNNAPDSTNEFDPKDIADNKVMAILAYLGILVLVPLFGAKNSKFARFHANQGIILCITTILYSIVYTAITKILIAISWRLFSMLSGIFSLVGLVFLAWIIIGIINAANGKAKELPVIGKFRILK